MDWNGMECRVYVLERNGSDAVRCEQERHDMAWYVSVCLFVCLFVAEGRRLLLFALTSI